MDAPATNAAGSVVVTTSSGVVEDEVDGSHSVEVRCRFGAGSAVEPVST
jgi:hypothetical protein